MTIALLAVIAVTAILGSNLILWLYSALVERAHSDGQRLLWCLVWVPFLIAPGYGILVAAIRFAGNFAFERSAFTTALWTGLIPPLFLWAASIFVQARLLRRRLDTRHTD